MECEYCGEKFKPRRKLTKNPDKKQRFCSVKCRKKSHYVRTKAELDELHRRQNIHGPNSWYRAKGRLLRRARNFRYYENNYREPNFDFITKKHIEKRERIKREKKHLLVKAKQFQYFLRTGRKAEVNYELRSCARCTTMISMPDLDVREPICLPCYRQWKINQKAYFKKCEQLHKKVKYMKGIGDPRYQTRKWQEKQSILPDENELTEEEWWQDY